MEQMELTTRARILLLYANTYDMLDEKQQQKTGCSVHYLFYGDSGEQIATQSEYDTSRPVGYQRAKCSIEMALRSKIPYAPAIYDGEFVMSVGSDGKPVLKLRDVAFVSMADIVPRVNPGVVVPGMVVPCPYQAAPEDSRPAKAAAKT